MVKRVLVAAAVDVNNLKINDMSENFQLFSNIVVVVVVAIIWLAMIIAIYYFLNKWLAMLENWLGKYLKQFTRKQKSIN